MNDNPENGGDHQDVLRDREERYRLLVQSVKDYAIFMLDPTGHVASWNAGAERIKGYSADDIIGKHFSTFYPPEEIASGKPADDLEVASREGRFEDEGWRLRKDGSRFWASLLITALRDEAGHLRGFAKVTRDLTERRHAEAQARELARAETAREAAEAESRRKDEFLSLLAHELRNPLTPILNGLAVMGQSSDDEPLRNRVLAMMNRQVRQLKRMIDDLLDVARLSSAKVPLRPRRLDLARLVRATVEDRRGVLEQIDLTLTVETPPTPVWVRGDDTRLAQVLSNLLDNAAKFTDPGGHVAVRLSVEGPNNDAVLVVRDNGIGIAPEVLRDIFDPLIQADHSLDRARGGLGLGLAVVKGLVQLHDGRVTAFSAGLGQGSTFTVRLPTEAEPPALTTPSVEPAKRRRVLRVVVVEDNRDAADSLRMLLELLGHEVRVAVTGPDGLRLVAEWHPDAVISDIGLPGLDGYALAAELRRRGVAGRARLIALTGYGSAEDRRRGKEAGFDDYLVKPADPDELRRLLPC